MLSGLALMVQAAVLDGRFFDPIPPFDDGGVASEEGVGGRDVAEALVVAVVVIVIDESVDLAFKISGQVIFFQQDTVFQGVVPTLDLALGLRMICKRRRREREGLQHLGIDVPSAFIELMITERYLTEPDAADRHAIEKAVETFLADLVRQR